MNDEEPSRPGDGDTAPSADAADGAPALGPGDPGHDIAWPIPMRVIYPLSAVLVALMVWAFGFSPLLVSLLPLMVLFGAITVIDLRELRVPNALLKPTAVVAIPLLAVASTADWPDVSLTRALIGGAVMFGVYLLIWLIYPAGMGMGDVKLAPFIGAQLALFGWVTFMRGLLLAHLISGPFAIGLLLFRRAGRQTGFPFAPFMIAGAVAALVLEGRFGA